MNIGDLTTDALYVGDEKAVAAYCGTDLVWTGGSNIDYSQEYLTFEIVSAGTLTFGASSTALTKVIQYSIDNGSTWTSWTGDTGNTAINVSAGDKVKVKNVTDRYCDFWGFINKQYLYFGGTAYFNLFGNIMSLLYGDNFTGQTSISGRYNTFRGLFRESRTVSVENLIMPATTLASSCYHDMFSGCTSLTSAPELPSTNMEMNCYNEMFRGCTSLTSAPELPATTLKTSCYEYMFYGCSNLNYVKCLATSVPSGTCNSWLSGVSATGTFVKDSSASWTSGASGIPSGWTVQDA